MAKMASHLLDSKPSLVPLVVFKALDKDQKGLSLPRLRDYLISKVNPKAEEMESFDAVVARVFAAMDKDGNGRVMNREFTQWLKGFKRAEGAKRFQAAKVAATSTQVPPPFRRHSPLEAHRPRQCPASRWLCHRFSSVVSSVTSPVASSAPTCLGAPGVVDGGEFGGSLRARRDRGLARSPLLALHTRRVRNPNAPALFPSASWLLGPSRGRQCSLSTLLPLGAWGPTPPPPLTADLPLA